MDPTSHNEPTAFCRLQVLKNLPVDCLESLKRLRSLLSLAKSLKAVDSSAVKGAKVDSSAVKGVKVVDSSEVVKALEVMTSLEVAKSQMKGAMVDASEVAKNHLKDLKGQVVQKTPVTNSLDLPTSRKELKAQLPRLRLRHRRRDRNVSLARRMGGGGRGRGCVVAAVTTM